MSRYLALVLLLFSQLTLAVEFSSSDTRTTVIELYTSEGCSSCPPADEWLSTFKDAPDLFSSVIPMAFHVDYWDYLGWKDPWSQAEFSQRQRNLAGQGNRSEVLSKPLLSQVYTPGVLVAGHEWTRWRNSQRLPALPLIKKGILSAKLDGQSLSVTYSIQGDYQLNIAYLGMGLVSNINAGENRSRQLKHDFVVLNHLTQKGHSTWEITLPAIPNKGQRQTAISIWLTQPDSLDIEQATAAFIE